MNLKNCKEELIEITISLINENKGDVDKVTIRDIADRSGVSVGLINYHFGNKENLITECVQKIVSGVVNNFKPDMEVGKGLSPFEAGKARLVDSAQKVFGFFFLQPSISRISILDDYNKFTNESSTYFSLTGFSNIIGDAIKDKEEKERISYALTTNMQVTFLRTLTDPKFMGYNFSKREDRDKYIKDTVDLLMRE